jgi:pyruvate kinase
MSHGDHKSHKAVVDLVKEYNKLNRNNVAIMLDTKGPEVRSGDVTEPIDMKPGTDTSVCRQFCHCISSSAGCWITWKQDACKVISTWRVTVFVMLVVHADTHVMHMLGF